jgi:hypothetical protein
MGFREELESGREAFGHLIRVWHERNGWSQRVLPALAERLDLGRVHNSQLSMLRNHKLLSPGPELFLTLGRLNGLLAEQGGGQGQGPGIGAELASQLQDQAELLVPLQASALALRADDGQALGPTELFEIFVGLRQPPAAFDLRIAETNLSNNSLIKEIEEKRILLGTTSREKILQIELQILRASQAQKKAAADLRTGFLNLKVQLGLQEEEALNLGIPNELPLQTMDEESAFREAKENRPEYLSFERRRLEAERPLPEDLDPLHLVVLLAESPPDPDPDGGVEGITARPRTWRSPCPRGMAPRAAAVARITCDTAPRSAITFGGRTANIGVTITQRGSINHGYHNIEHFVASKSPA